VLVLPELVASLFVQTIEHRQGLKIACLEEIGLLKGWLTLNELNKVAEAVSKTSYGNYLKNLVAEHRTNPDLK